MSYSNILEYLYVKWPSRLLNCVIC